LQESKENAKPGICHIRVHNAEKSLSFCHLTKQRLINELADGGNERYGWHDDALLDHRPKFRVFTEKASSALSNIPSMAWPIMGSALIECH
jgi:hypothetical protein